MGYGLLVFLWLSPEESQVWLVTLLGLGVSTLSLSALVMNKLGGKSIPAHYVLPGAFITGVVVGLGASLATTSLMFFKTALHAHLFPDFPVLLMLAVLQHAPTWALAGGLAGLGLALAWFAFGRAYSTEI